MSPTPPAALRRGPRATGADGSRDRVLIAARREFAAHGFAGASVDRIAAAARLNKAMIYYHFRSKAELYREILRDMFGAAGARIRDVAASPISPEEKVRRFIRAIATEAEARPHFPPIWFREIADGGAHLDDATLGEIAGIVRTLAGFIAEGVRTGRFKPIDPLLVHGGIVGPLLLFFASAPLRERLEELGVRGSTLHERPAVLAHVERVTLGVLQGRMPPASAPEGSAVSAPERKVRHEPDARARVTAARAAAVRSRAARSRGPEDTRPEATRRRTVKR
jgi:AcrR family transcriptional regulator